MLFISALEGTMWTEVTKRITKPNLWFAPTGIRISSRQTDFFVVVVISLMRSIVLFHLLWNSLLTARSVCFHNAGSHPAGFGPIQASYCSTSFMAVYGSYS